MATVGELRPALVVEAVPRSNRYEQPSDRRVMAWVDRREQVVANLRVEVDGQCAPEPRVALIVCRRQQLQNKPRTERMRKPVVLAASLLCQ